LQQRGAGGQTHDAGHPRSLIEAGWWVLGEQVLVISPVGDIIVVDVSGMGI